MLRVYKLFIGLTATDVNFPISRDTIIDAVSKKTDSFTVCDADGHRQGEREDSLVITIAHDDHDYIGSLAQELCVTFHQEAVGLEYNGGYHHIRADDKGSEDYARVYTLTSESVSEGHPDKIADIISDTILDLFLRYDPGAKVACETFVTSKAIIISGEFRTAETLFRRIKEDIPHHVRQLLRDIGYRSDFPGIDPETCDIQLLLNTQSDDIYQGVALDNSDTGAGDQGIVFGYACKETPEYLPLPIVLAHKLVKRQAEVRKSGLISYLRPDAKAQVSIRYNDSMPVAVESVVFSTQHSEDADIDRLRQDVTTHIIDAIFPVSLVSSDTKYLINPTGRFVIGGPTGDTGLTGRKIIVDTYGGRCPHGGGAFSGKDPTKVDRSGAYIARYLAKNIVAAELATQCTIQISYSIGIATPVSVYVDTHGTGRVDETEIEDYILQNVDLTPKGVIDLLDLKRPVYKSTATYGHFSWGDRYKTWERLGHVGRLRTHFRIGTGSPDALREQEKLGQFVSELNAGEVSKEVYSWWLSRY